MNRPRITFVRRRKAWRISRKGWRTFTVYAWALRPSFWLLAVLTAAALLLSQGNPHLRVWYAYEQRGDAKLYTRCDYWGLQPFTLTWTTHCPLLIVMQGPQDDIE